MKIPNKTLKVTVVLSVFMFMLSTAFPPILVAQTYTVSGRVTDSSSGLGIDGVTITFIGVPSGIETTSGGGNYSHTVAPGWVGTVIPSFLPGYTFAPVSAPIGSVEGNVTQDFTAEEPGTIIVEKQTEPSGGTGFDFLRDFDIPFSLDDGARFTILYVPAGEYTVTEADPAPSGFDLIDVTCEDPDGGSSIDLDARTATIDLDAGETITCTFTNGVPPPPPPPEPIGGIVVPVNRLELLAPWLGLVALASLATLTVAVVRRRKG